MMGWISAGKLVNGMCGAPSAVLFSSEPRYVATMWAPKCPFEIPVGSEEDSANVIVSLGVHALHCDGCIPLQCARQHPPWDR